MVTNASRAYLKQMQPQEPTERKLRLEPSPESRDTAVPQGRYISIAPTAGWGETRNEKRETRQLRPDT